VAAQSATKANFRWPRLPAERGRCPRSAASCRLAGGLFAEAKGGIEYNKCGNAYYRAAFQGNNLVYAVVPKP
jgi:hypothetical protein